MEKVMNYFTGFFKGIVGIILSIIIFIVGITIFGVRIACELIKDGIPEMDEDGNYIEKETEQTTVSPPWV